VISADNVKAIVMTPARAEIPVLEAAPIDLLAYDALLSNETRMGKVGA
jgi:hypothetical protein